MDLSIVIPLLNEEESLPELEQWIRRVMEREGYSYEIIFVDDGSTDKSWKIIKEMIAQRDTVKGIKFRRNYGKSAALNTGFAQAEGEVVFTMDADLQDSPEELPEMRRMILEEDFDIVSGWKKKRFDPLSKTIPTKLYNGVTTWMSGIKLHDMNCGLKAYRKEVVKSIEVYGEMHRYIPVIAKWSGFVKVGEKVVQHQARKYGETKFGLSRFVKGPLDLLSIMFVGKFSKQPMHFFGAMGGMVFFIGFLLFFILGVNKAYHLAIGETAKNLADISWFYVGLTAMIIGTMLFVTGFLAELVSRNAPHRNMYLIEEELGWGKERKVTIL